MVAGNFLNKYLVAEWHEFLGPILANDDIMKPVISYVLSNLRAKIPMVPTVEKAFAQFDHVLPDMVKVLIITDTPYTGSATQTGCIFHRTVADYEECPLKTSNELKIAESALSAQMMKKYQAAADLSQRMTEVAASLKTATEQSTIRYLDAEMKRLKKELSDLYDKMNMGQEPSNIVNSHWPSQGVLCLNLGFTHVENQYDETNPWNAFIVALVEELLSVNSSIVVAVVGRDTFDKLNWLSLKGIKTVVVDEIIYSGMFVDINQLLNSIYKDPEEMIDWSNTLIS